MFAILGEKEGDMHADDAREMCIRDRVSLPLVVGLLSDWFSISCAVADGGRMAVALRSEKKSGSAKALPDHFMPRIRRGFPVI